MAAVATEASGETVSVTIPGRCNGPADSGNGGYTAGLLAQLLPPAPAGHAVQVTLRTPPPLDTPLTVVPTGDTCTVRTPDGSLVAEAGTVPFDDAPTPPVAHDDATAAARTYPGFMTHPFPRCFVCGTDRPRGDGLAIYPGPVTQGRTAAPWRVPDDVTPATVWAALDCPGGWAILSPGQPYVLGRFTARVTALPAAGDECVVTGALRSLEGRKAYVDTALYAPDGGCLAHAGATWIAIPGEGAPPAGAPSADR